jgi:hypothetical protein
MMVISGCFTDLTAFRLSLSLQYSLAIPVLEQVLECLFFKQKLLLILLFLYSSVTFSPQEALHESTIIQPVVPNSDSCCDNSRIHASNGRI